MTDRPGSITEDQLASGWIARMAEGESEALDALYHLYHRQVLSLLLRMLKDRFEAEEVLQDTFVRAYRNAALFDARSGTPFTWLMTIGRRLAVDRLRRRRSRPDTENWEQPERLADQKEAREVIHADLEVDWMEEQFAALSERQRQTVRLAFLEGYSHPEIASLLDRPLGTVKSDLYRGLAQLKKAYEKRDD